MQTIPCFPYFYSRCSTWLEPSSAREHRIQALNMSKHLNGMNPWQELPRQRSKAARAVYRCSRLEQPLNSHQPRAFGEHEPACQHSSAHLAGRKRFSPIAKANMYSLGRQTPLSNLHFFNNCLEPKPAKQPAIKLTLCKLYDAFLTSTHALQRGLKPPLQGSKGFGV